MARLLTLALAAFAVAAPLSGCDDAGAGSDDPRAAIDVQISGDPEELAVYRELVAAYERSGGGRVRLIEVGDKGEHLAKLSTSFAARRAPDAFLINHRNLGPFAERGVLEPAGPRLGLRRARYFDVALAAFAYRGELQCVPQNVSSLVVYYNRDRFRAAGLGLPGRSWTYAAFLAAARKLTADGRHGVAVDPALIRAAPFVWSAGGALVDDVDAPRRFTLDTDAARRGLETFARLRREGLAPDAREAEAKPADQRFVEGDAAMLLSSRREVPVLRALVRDFAWDVAPFPVLARPASVLHSDGFCLARSGAREAAWRFVAFATGPAGQRILARGGRTVPSLRSVARSAAFLDPSRAPRSSEVFLDAVADLHRLPSTPGFERVEQSADIAVQELFYGRLSVDEALRRIADETDGRF